MESVYHIVTIRVNETSWAHVWRLHSRYLGMGYDRLCHCCEASGQISARALFLLYPFFEIVSDLKL
jgi:hypothetical protein